VQREADRLTVVLLDQLLEFQQPAVIGVLVVELHGALQADVLSLRAAHGG
jgi:hypothetical protein